jgi:A/G-specific adenine glycosylase
VMLQQTQVSRVEAFYPRFLKRFPDLEALARAPARAVREAWEGLGYYARARNLHELAKSVAGRGVIQNGVPRLPEDPEELIKLPGVGRYTAGAVASFAYEKSVPAVDTNVARVIRRVFFGERLIGKRLTRQRPIRPRQIWELATVLVPANGKRAWKFNQAIMELGALVCGARKPKCGECPVQPGCRTGKRTGRRRGAETSPYSSNTSRASQQTARSVLESRQSSPQ